MARAGWGRHNEVVNVGTYPDDDSYPVGTNEWNEPFHKGAGIFGFAAQTVAGHATTVVPNRSVVVLSGSTETGLFGLGDSEQYDVIWVFTSGSVVLTNRQTTPNADGQIVGLDTNATTITLSTTIPKIFIRRTVGSYDAWFEYGGGAASNLTVTNLAAGVLDTDITSVAGTDTTIPSAKAVKTYVDLQTHEAGDITGVTAGTGLSGGGTSGTVSLAVDASIATIASPTFTGTVVLPNVPAIVTTQLNLKSPIANPTFTGTVVLPNVPAIVTTQLNLKANAADAALTGDATAVNLTFSGRLKTDKGTDEASATELSLAADGNTFDITGTTTINTISPTNWSAGNVIHLQFDAITTVSHNSGGTNDILLGNQADMTTAAGDVLSLFYNGTDWVEISRSVVASGGGATDEHEFNRKGTTVNPLGTPQTSPVHTRKIYIRQIDTNNEGVFAKIAKNGSTNYVEVQLA